MPAYTGQDLNTIFPRATELGKHLFVLVESREYSMLCSTSLVLINNKTNRFNLLCFIMINISKTVVLNLCDHYWPCNNLRSCTEVISFFIVLYWSNISLVVSKHFCTKLKWVLDLSFWKMKKISFKYFSDHFFPYIPWQGIYNPVYFLDLLRYFKDSFTTQIYKLHYKSLFLQLKIFCIKCCC